MEAKIEEVEKILREAMVTITTTDALLRTGQMTEYDVNLLAHQIYQLAEISFKAGIKEVVDFVEKTAPGAYLRRNDWQAFKKERGSRGED